MKRLLIITIMGFVIASAAFGVGRVLAEQSGSSPESGATSYIKATYDSIVALGHGSVAAGSWGDWGSYWNRIRSAAEWVSSGTAGTGDVLSGKTFYNNTRSSQNGAYVATNLIPGNVKSGTSFGVGQTGTALTGGPCSSQTFDDADSGGQRNCSLTWTTNPSPVTGDDIRAGTNMDPMTGLTWSQYLKNNSGAIQFVASGGSSWSFNATAAANVAVGNLTAAQLCSSASNPAGAGVWRLPTEKELQQAYIDGSYWNLTNPSNNFWSATEYSAGSSAWSVYLTSGGTYTGGEGNGGSVRCVR